MAAVAGIGPGDWFSAQAVVAASGRLVRDPQFVRPDCERHLLAQAELGLRGRYAQSARRAGADRPTPDMEAESIPTDASTLFTWRRLNTPELNFALKSLEFTVASPCSI